jgi:quaternary ammonium compound-resistance protein SugE
MAWVLLIVAGLLETCFAVALKLSDGFSRPLPTALFALSAVGSFALLALALRGLPVGTAYAVWTGIGAAGTVAVGMAVLHEPVTPGRLAAIGLIVAGVIGLNLAGAAHQ